MTGEVAHAAEERLKGKGANRFRNRPPSVYADLRPALEGVAYDPEKCAAVFSRDKRGDGVCAEMSCSEITSMIPEIMRQPKKA